MFGLSVRERIQKDISTLEKARQSCISYMRTKGLMSEDEILLVDKIAFNKASMAYMNKPDLQGALSVLSESLKEETRNLGYEVK